MGLFLPFPMATMSKPDASAKSYISFTDPGSSPAVPVYITPAFFC